MTPMAITALATVNAMGIGVERMFAAFRENRSGCRPCDYEDAALQTYIGRVGGVEDNSLDGTLSVFDCRNNRLANMAVEADRFDADVASAVKRYGSDRIGVILGTSTSGIREGEYAFAKRDTATGRLPADFHFAQTQAFHSLTQFIQARLGLNGLGWTISTACSSSAKAFVDAAQLIEADICDAVVVGGADSLCLMTLYGFDSLQLLDREPCRPNDVNRAGISIGEGAAFALVERTDGRRSAMAYLLGCGESSDAYHISAPHPEGTGAEMSMRAALDSAQIQPGQIDYINEHGTGTRQNDPMEDAAIARVFGPGMRCSSTKGATGHTLGASGAIEATICISSLLSGMIPGNTNIAKVDPDFRCNVVTEPCSTKPHFVLNNSFGFGGNNCSLVFGAA